MVSLKTNHLKRYKDVAMLLVKYGRSDLVTQAGLGEGLDLDETTLAKEIPEAEELAADLERLGPTFIKLGQLLSTRADLLPPPYLDALTRLQDQIAPFPYEQVDAIVSGELGVRISKAFLEFEAEPIGSASLAQVHRAYMRDGRAVVVKVQRPDIREQIVEDLEALEGVAHFLDTHTELGKRYDFGNMLAGLRKESTSRAGLQKRGPQSGDVRRQPARIQPNRGSGTDYGLHYLARPHNGIHSW